MDIDGIVLAAGLSTRMGAHKMVLPIGDKTIIEACIDEMLSVCSRVIVVGGYKIDNLEKVLYGRERVELIFNKNYRDGMLSSIKAGILHCRGDRIFIMPGDHPFVSRKVYQSMLAAEGKIVIPVFDGRTGHPVLMSRNAMQSLLRDNKSGSLSEFIKAAGAIRLPVQEKTIYFDIDTCQDYQRAVCFAKAGEEANDEISLCFRSGGDGFRSRSDTGYPGKV